MPNVRAQYEPVAWWLTKRRLGRSLRERYEDPTELPPGLLTLVKKLHALEGNQSLRECKERLQDLVEGPGAS